MTIDFNSDFQQAWLYLEDTREHLFITGQAGTGKSTLLQHFTANSTKKLAVCAPTGVAALNVGGETIHTLFGFSSSVTVHDLLSRKQAPRRARLFKHLDTLVIDEISMVRADLLDCIDTFLKRWGPHPGQPFGGIQVVMFGDLYQLPPVVTSSEKAIFSTHYPTPYFFSARVMSQIDLRMIELSRIYRQSEPAYIELLHSVRFRTITETDITQLNSMVQPDYQPPPDKLAVRLTTINAKADEINARELNRLTSHPHTFEGALTGSFEPKSLPAPLTLTLKVGAQVMMTANAKDKSYVNGTVGKVTHINRKQGIPQVTVTTHTGQTTHIAPYTWEMTKYRFDPHSQMIRSDTVGSFYQLPMILAWAVTIHKSQGKTFDHVIIDLSRGSFAHGQTYVALSRCTTLSGMVFTHPIKKSHILLDWRVVKFLTSHQYHQAHQTTSVDQIKQVLQTALSSHSRVRMTYLKSSNVKSNRDFEPQEIGRFEYQSVQFEGVRGHDLLRGEERVFRLDRILDIAPVDK